MRKSPLKRTWDSLLYGAGRDVLAVAIAGALMLSESPVGFVHYAFADPLDDGIEEPVGDTASDEDVDTEDDSDQDSFEEEDSGDQGGSDLGNPGGTGEGSEDADSNDGGTIEDENVDNIEDGEIFLSTKLFGELKLFSLFLVDEEGNIDAERTTMPELGLTITNEHDWRFVVKPNDNYVIDSVAYRVEDDTKVELTATNDIYAIPEDVITEAALAGKTFTLEVEAHATAVEVDVDLSTYALYAVTTNGTRADSPTATFPTDSFNIPLDPNSGYKDYVFEPVTLDGSDIELVTAQVGSEADVELEANEKDAYTITAALIQEAAESGDAIQLTVDKTGVATESIVESNLPVPIAEESTVSTTNIEEMAETEPIVASDALGPDAYNYSKNLEDYLDRNYDTDEYGVSSITINGKPIDEVSSIAYGDDVRINLVWGFPNTIKITEGTQFTFKLPEAIGWIFDSEAARGGVYDSAANQVGSFVIGSDGVATITYDKDLGSNVVGTFSADGRITRVTNTGDNAIVSFSLAGRKWNLQYVSRDAKVEVNKTGGNYVPDASDLTLRQFTIEAFSIGENENIVITDTPTMITVNGTKNAALELVEDSLHVYADEACTELVDDGRVSIFTNDDGTFDIHISKMSDFEHLYISYMSHITLDAYNAAIGRSWNHGQASTGDSYDRQITAIDNTAIVTNSETSTVGVPTFRPSYVRQKKGSYDANTRTITWTVQAITGDTTLTLQDFPGETLEDIQDIHLYESTDGGKTYTEVSTSVARNLTPSGLMDGSATLPSATTAGANRFFRITYVTPVNPYWVGQTNYENWIAGNGNLFHSGKGVGAWVTVTTNTEVTIQKAAVPDAGYVNFNAAGEVIDTPEDIHWVSHVNIPTSDTPYSNFVITDTEQNGSEQQLKPETLHIYSDAEQTNEITNQFKVNFTYGSYRGTQYCNGFTLTSDNFKGGEFYISIDAKIISVTYTKGFVNKIRVSATEFATKESSATYMVYGHRISKRPEPDLASPADGWRGGSWTHTNSTTGRVTWSIVLSGLGHNELDLDPDIILTDVAPNSLVVDPDSFRYVIGSIDKYHSVVTQGGSNSSLSDITPVINGDTLTITVNKGGDAYEALRAGKSIVILYDTTYNPQYTTDGFSSTGDTDVVTNTVSLTFGEKTSDQTQASFKFPRQPLLVKEATYNEQTAPYAFFTIECNNYSGDLDPNSDFLTLTDEAGSALSINTESIAVTTYDIAGKVVDNGVPILEMADRGFTYTRDTRTGIVTFTVPDGTHFKLTYKSLVMLAPGVTVEDESASNSVTLNGYGTPITTKIGSEIYASRATTTSLGYGVSVEKIDADYQTLHVAGATYAVQRVDVNKDGNTWTVSGDEFAVVGSVTTETSGYSQPLTGLAADQIYRLVETDSPEGYLLSDDVFYLVFKGQQGAETIDYDQITLLDETGAEVELNAYSSNTATQRILRSDHQVPGSLTIVKNTLGSTTTPAGTTFTITGPNGYSQVVTYSQFSDGVLTIDNLVPGSYTVTEDATSAEKIGYSLETSVPGDDGEELGNSQTVVVAAGATGEAAAQAVFTNTYSRFETQVPVAKNWVGPEPADATVTVHLLADGARLDPDVSLELSAETNWRGTFTGLPRYNEEDGSEIAYTVEEDAFGGYEASYAGDATTGFTITNTFDAQASISATKYAYGQQHSYSFSLVGATAEGAERSSAAGTIEGEAGVVDLGQSLRLSATTGAYSGTRAQVSFPEISYREPGDYYYLMSEDYLAGEPYDDTVYLVHVAVDSDASVTVDYTPQGVGSTTDSAEFYNNGGLMLFGRRAVLAAETDEAQTASFQPVAHKELDGRALADGEFTFALIDEAGNTVSEATNDIDGVVAFDRISYTEPGTYRYTMVEVNTGQPGVDYDLTEHSVEVVVSNEDGVLSVSSATYDGSETEPTFANAVQVVIVRIRKVSRDGTGDPLFNSVYGLWIEGAEGQADVYLGNDASDEDGYIYIENVPVVEGATYYFKEESAPEGHLVDPYRIAHFRIDRASDGGYVLVSLED